MIVFSNTTPFIALASVGKLDLLPTLFSTVYVVEDVVEECAQGGTIPLPDLSELPWIKIVPAHSVSMTSILLELDRGEKHTINTAIAMKADKLIIDEKIGRNVAEYLGLSVVGTLGILLKAKSLGLILSFSELVAGMQRNGIHYHPDLVLKLSRQVGE